MISILIFLCRQTANVYVDVVYRLIGGALRPPPDAVVLSEKVSVLS